MRINLYQYGGSETIYWDDVTVTAVPPVNGGFETGSLAPWDSVTSGSGSVAIGSIAHSGSYGVTETATTGQDIAYQDVFGFTPGQIYIVSAWVSATGANTAALAIQDTLGNGFVENTVTASTSWQQVSQAFVADNTAAMRIHLYAMAGSQTVYWDDVTAVPVPPLNGGFETGTLADWNTLVTSGGTVGVGTIAHSGNYGLTETPSNGQDIAYQDISGLIPGQTYVASAWVKATGANTVALVIHDTQGNELVENTITANTTWQQISQAFVADSTAAMRVHLYAMPGTQTVYWDDVVVTGGVLSPTLGQAFVNVWSNFNGVDLWQDFSVMISGQVTAGGSGLSGVSVSLTGTESEITTTDPNGQLFVLGTYSWQLYRHAIAIGVYV